MSICVLIRSLGLQARDSWKRRRTVVTFSEIVGAFNVLLDCLV